MKGRPSFSGAVATIPTPVREELVRRLEAHAAKHFKEACRRIEVRFRGPHAYVDAVVNHTWFMPGTTEEEKEEIRNAPVKLCRLTYLPGRRTWGFAFYKASGDTYEPSMTMRGSFEGTPEDCLDCAGFAYLRDVW